MKNGRRRKTAELEGFRCEPSIRAAVKRAALANNFDGKRFDHQRRIRQTAILKSCKALQSAIPELHRCRDFERLMRLIEGTLSQIDGIGNLYIYDTALRIGAKLELLPEMIYLHSGTRVGARRLGLNFKGRALGPHELPAALRALKPYEVEDILCIYKGRFGDAPKN
jgi:hypothetical protein